MNDLIPENISNEIGNYSLTLEALAKTDGTEYGDAVLRVLKDFNAYIFKHTKYSDENDSI